MALLTAAPRRRFGAEQFDVGAIHLMEMAMS